jgi:Methyltransferase domain
MDPITENSLIGLSKLSRPSEDPTTIDPYRKVECAAVFKRKSLRGQLRRAIKGNGGRRRERFPDAGSTNSGRKLRAVSQPKCTAGHLDGEARERRNGINAACAKQDKPRASRATKLQKINCAAQIILHKLAAGSLSHAARQHAGIRSGVDDPVHSGQGTHITSNAKIAVNQMDPKRSKRRAIQLAAGATEIVDAVDLYINAVLKQRPRNRATHKAARSGNENLHGLVKSLANQHLRSPLDSVLEFGCGWGRIIRLFTRDVEPQRLWGIDCLPVAIDTCKQTNPYARFELVDPFPPTRLPSDAVDLVYAYSVFSHLFRSF